VVAYVYFVHVSSECNGAAQRVIYTEFTESRDSYVQIRVNETRNIVRNCRISTFKAHI